MAYKFCNVKTGETITTSNRVGGKNWKLMEEPIVDTPEETPEETLIEETPVEKPVAKATRKGKK